jgi:hypothetical protein
VIQAANCNHQTPAKLYEYLRAGKPVFGITDPAGDTAATLRAAGCPLEQIARLDDEDDITCRLGDFINSLRASRAIRPDPATARTWSREGQARTLASILDRVKGLGVAGNGARP